MFYSTVCLKVGAYFQNVFELNTDEYKLLGFTIPHLEADSGDRYHTNGICCKANRPSIHVFLDYDNDKRELCMKMGTYFNGVFELNTVKHKRLRFAIPHLVADST